MGSLALGAAPWQTVTRGFSAASPYISAVMIGMDGLWVKRHCTYGNCQYAHAD